MVSIVVPTYNEQENIKKLLLLIHHAFNKNLQDYEVIVIDDRSTDNTWEILQREEANFPLRIFQKQGKRGKSNSLFEGFQKARGNILAMIDADLQYTPEAIPQMARALDANCDVIVANRKRYHASPLRKILSRGFKHFFGKMLFGLDSDIQSGLKVFKREVLETVKFKPHSAWTFDLEFLHRARLAGFQIKNIDITFYPRTSGRSQINVLKNGFELATNAASLKLKRIHPQHIPPKVIGSMLGAGVGFSAKKYITHTTLPHQVSAIRGFLLWQKLTIAAVLAAISISFYMSTLTTAIVLVAILSTIYLLDVLFNFALIAKSLYSPPEISITGDELSQVDEKQLPTYTILCPLYKEAAVLPHFLDALDKLDWPKDKLDVLLLLEEDDQETQEAVSRLSLPSYVRPIIVPQSWPKTKPKACNFGLSHAKGEFLVIYDAEDVPEVDQLKKAYLAFQKTSPNVVCLQAKLNYYNP
ncbi:MAG: glycosyltransferase, partial [Patescibacteria group bacterium]